MPNIVRAISVNVIERRCSMRIGSPSGSGSGSPDTGVVRPDDARPVVPDDLRSMTVTQVGDLGDPQLARALSVVASAIAPAS